MEKKTETEKPSWALSGAAVFFSQRICKIQVPKKLDLWKTPLFVIEIDVCIYIIIYAAYAN